MQAIHKLVIIAMITVLPLKSQAAPAFDIPEKIFKAIEFGNVENLCNYFNESIELILISEEGIYSKSQAKQILKDFYHKYKPKSFKVLHQGGSEESKYAIGTLQTSKGKLRVHFLVKMKEGNPLIHQLRIQEE